jgi:hypothetical protein
MLSCREVTRKVASAYISAARPWERFMMRFHLMMCRHCRRYETQLHNIRLAARSLRDQSAEEDTLERLENQILNKLGESDHQS